MNKTGLKDLHVHTNYSDGKNTPEEMVLSAIEKGLSVVGLADHSYTPFDLVYCMREEKEEERFYEINRLKEKYRDKITVLCGIEQDFYSAPVRFDYDYVIGAVHYIKSGDVYIPVDDGADISVDGANRCFGGDIYALLEAYYETVGNVVQKTHPDIIAHIDLICKHNEKHPFFDADNPRYINAWKKAADKLLKAGVPFEINSGAVSRGYKTLPYPSPDIYEYLKNGGAEFIRSSDAHAKENICFMFDFKY